MTYEELAAALGASSTATVAELLGYKQATVDSWKTGRLAVPYKVAKAIELLRLAELRAKLQGASHA